MRSKLWYGMAVALILTDMGMTYWAVTNNHAKEANPVVKDAMEEYGIAAALIGGGLLRSSTVLLAGATERFLPRYEWTMPLIAVLSQSPPVVWNTFLLLA